MSTRLCFFVRKFVNTVGLKLFRKQQIMKKYWFFLHTFGTSILVLQFAQAIPLYNAS